MTDFFFLGGDMAEAELTGFRGRPRGRGGAVGVCAIGRGGRPRRGGNSGVSSSVVIAGLSLWIETTSVLLPTWRRNVLRERDNTL